MLILKVVLVGAILLLKVLPMMIKMAMELTVLELLLQKPMELLRKPTLLL
jgi:hypothetical protein